MKNNNLEDQLKDAFGNFEPEVDPSLWTKISSQLPATPSPVQPVAEPSGILSSLSSAGTWIAGAAAIVVAGAGIVFVLNNEPAAITDKKSPSSEISVATAPQTNNPVESEVVEPTQSGISEETSAPSTVAIEQKPVTHETASGSNTGAAKEAVTTGSMVANSTPNQAAPVTAPKPSIPAGTPVLGQSEQHINESAVPLRLIVTANGGFAPLAVTMLSNQPGKKSDFDFGDGYTAQAESASHTYKVAGFYTVNCSVDNQQAEQFIEVFDALPSAFSPNGDGANDAFIIDNADLREIEIRIYQRNGRQIFSGKGSSVSWNGQYSDGRPAETGTYFYDIFATSLRGNVYKQKGTLTLFR
jgi:gliding motility-associated-like protein